MPNLGLLFPQNLIEKGDRNLIAMIKHNSLKYNALVMKIAISLDSRTKGGCSTFQKHMIL
jgi:hypothetical protein